MAIEKSKAQEYRDERKMRIAEAAKKNAKNMQKKNATKKLAKRIVSIVLVAAIALGAVGVALNYYGVWDRTVKAGSLGEAGKFTLAEYEYYYYSAYSNLMSSFSQSYDTQGYDTSKPPHEQTTMTEDEEGNPISWVAYLRIRALDMLQAQKVVYNEAVKAGKATLTEEEKKQIDETIEAYRQQAESEQYKMTLNAYLRMQFGEYMNEKFFRTIMERQLVVNNYYTYKLEEIQNSYTAEKLEEIYNKDKNAYDMVDFRIYGFAEEQLTIKQGESAEAFSNRQKESNEKTKKDAEDFLASVTDEASFIAAADKAEAAKKAEEEAKKEESDTDTQTQAEEEKFDADKDTLERSILKSNATSISNDCAEWLFNADTKVGDKKLFESKDGSTYYIVYMIAKPHQVNTVNVRHILFATTDSMTGAALSAEEIAKKKSDAEAALKKWQEGDKTAESFGTLATQLTEDTGSQATGGLYEDVYPGMMVDEFNDWIFAEGRKAGDTGIVETDFGYHVMYFESTGGKYYESAIKSSAAQTDTEAALEAIIDSEAYKIDTNDSALKYAEKQMNNHIADMMAQQAANQQQYSYY